MIVCAFGAMRRVLVRNRLSGIVHGLPGLRGGEPGFSLILLSVRPRPERTGRIAAPGNPYPQTHELEPELKKVSILFVDITNSVHLIHKLRPEESAEYLEPTLNVLKQSAHRYGGMINRVDGDGMMVIFGAPIAYEDHAVRACYAALDMLKAVKGEFEATRIGVRVGVHSGEVLMKPFYNDFSVDYEALGPTVYLAHRMEVLASPNTAIISRETYRLAQKHIRALDAGPTQVKGLDQTVHVFQLQGRISQQSDQAPRLEQNPSLRASMNWRSWKVR